MPSTDAMAQQGSPTPPADSAAPANAAQRSIAAQRANTTQRSRAKENRRQALLTAAASLFAVNGFNRVSLEDLGAAAGVSGPAVYRHFPGKQAVLADLLVTVSRELLEGGREVVDTSPDPLTALRGLVEFQVDFALGKPDVIRVQDRDLSNLSEQDQATVRGLQRSYVEVWVDVLTQLHPDTDSSELRMRAHATFGLINSTPHSVRNHGRRIAVSTARPLLEGMALAALAASTDPAASQQPTS